MATLLIFLKKHFNRQDAKSAKRIKILGIKTGSF